MEDPSSLCNCSFPSPPFPPLFTAITCTMEDQKINHHLLKLHPPSSSSLSSTTSNQLSSAAPPPEAEVAQHLGFFNLQTASSNNHLYHALQIPSSNPTDHLLPTILSSMINNYNQPPYLTGGIGRPVKESAHINENSGDAVNSSRMMGGKRRKTNNNNNNDDKEEVMENPREVIHVRAKRGQATDSHSLAERVRRERINEKLRVLQDLVPGCYNTMGMAVMLDVIINYVRSLQNQIEFLSMKLSSTSMFCDFNSPLAEGLETIQQRENPCEAREIETMITRDEGFEGINAASAPVDDQSLHSTWPF